MANAHSSEAPPTPVDDDAVQPRLTRLEMIGFKSFASRTQFQFERGITAIIGPNGSGKSNIADAVRWALGETSYTTLRGKKTEDVIFAGGQGKAPAGMAEVTLTFDNTTGWLPIEFTEVSITRRAFRSGETAYLINGRKVRLKDVHQLTASLGQSYTVVGQGLVDSALSQRAEDRRGLFEHAADLAGLRLKAVEAERNLAESDANTSRLNDLLSESEPRLRSMERAARQANEYKGVRDRLRQLQRSHFRVALTEIRVRRARAEDAAGFGETEAVDLQKRHDELVAESAVLRLERETAGDTLARHRAGLATLGDHLRRLMHERELANERLAALLKRHEDMAETQQGLDEQITSVEANLIDARAQLGLSVSAAEAARVQLTEAELAVNTERADQVAVEREHARLMAVVTDRDRQIADVGRRKALLVQRAETDASERERNSQADRTRAERMERLNADISALKQAEETSGFRLTSIDAGVIEKTTLLNAAVAEANLAQQSVQSIERELADSSARLRELRRIHESGAGLYAGVRAVVQAARDKKLGGVRGTLAELIQLPGTYDTAIEVALGGHLQDIVVEQWTHAEQAIAYLKKQKAGRATFQPIDTVRGRRVPADVLRGVTGLAGVHGVACDLLTYPTELDGIAAALLGRSLIVEDLDVARACLPHLPGGWNAITVSGEIVRTSGSVTGGTAVRESGSLARERELRDLPGEIAELQTRLDAARADFAALAERPKKIQEERQQFESERTAILATRREREQQRTRILSWLDESQREDNRVRARVALLDQQRAEFDQSLASLDSELERLTIERDSSRSQLDVTLEKTSLDRSVSSVAEIALRDAQRLIATIEERLSAERRRESGLLAQQSALHQERSLRSERAALVEGEITAVGAQVARLTTEVLAQQTSHDTAESELDPLARAFAAVVERLTEIETALEKVRTSLLEAERKRGLTGMELERVRGEEVALHQRIADDLNLDDPSAVLVPDDGESPGELVGEDTEREIARLKDRLRRVGYAGDNAVEDYERELERYMFLRDQLTDVEGAAESIRLLLDDVHQTMRQRFEETFNRVSDIFSQTFSSLFGGGTARLVMVADDSGDNAGGVDIVAQPPGKRLQSLALLSGGERALTGVALLFAILKVNPTPFCMLDEVDAALDEANVVRFRDQMMQLSHETQAIIVTHNRGTIEVANTLYGISMRDDGTSQVLSLRLADVVLAD